MVRSKGICRVLSLIALIAWSTLLNIGAQSAIPARATNAPVVPALQAFTIQIPPGADLLDEVTAFAKSRDIYSGFVLSVAGGLNQIALQYAQQTNTTVITGRWSIVSLTGLLNRTNADLRISASDENGRTIGGRLMRGSRAEDVRVALAELNDTTVPAPVVQRPSIAASALFSPEIQPNRRVMFRLRAPGATDVSVAGDWGGGSKQLTKDANGSWSGTVGPLDPEIYSYTFSVDGLRMLDPGNSWVKPSRSPRTSVFNLQGDTLQLHDLQAVPHGVLRQHTYDSKSLKRGRKVTVYTPPDYEKNALSRYPTLYLLHEMGGTEDTWSVLGRVHMIMDNLINTGKARPMLIVMADAHPLPPEGATADYRARNNEAMRLELIQEVIPFIETNYRAMPRREARGIAGSAMGGGQAVTIGLTESATFSIVGGFSPLLSDADELLAASLTDAKAVNDRMKLLWLACGKDDFLIDQARKFDQLLSSKMIKHTYLETEGAHSWLVWRKYFAEFVPLLFLDLVEPVSVSRP